MEFWFPVLKQILLEDQGTGPDDLCDLLNLFYLTALLHINK